MLLAFFAFCPEFGAGLIAIARGFAPVRRRGWANRGTFASRRLLPRQGTRMQSSELGFEVPFDPLVRRWCILPTRLPGRTGVSSPPFCIVLSKSASTERRYLPGRILLNH